jgi:hypothetical protein
MPEKIKEHSGFGPNPDLRGVNRDRTLNMIPDCHFAQNDRVALDFCLPLGIYCIYTFREAAMSASSDSLLLKFRSKDSRFGVTRDTVKALASELDVSETLVVHMALAKLAEETLPSYEPDDGPLTAREVARVRKAAKATLPKGKIVERLKLF